MTDVALFHVDETNTVRFSLKNIVRQISGPEEAIQLVSYALFTTPGSCVFARQDGGGVLTLKGRNIQGNAELRTEAAVIVRRAMDTLRKAQRPGRAADATVTALQLIDAVGDPESATIKLTIRIRLQTGNSFTVNFEGQ